MKKRFSVAAAAILSVLVVGGGAALAAQDVKPPVPSAPPYFHGGHHGWGHHHSPYLRMCRDFNAHMAGMLAYDRVKLGITDAQRPAWRTLVHSLEQAQKPIRAACADLSHRPAAQTLPGRLEQGQKMAEARVESMRMAVPAIAKFYRTLTPAQKHIADRLAHGRGGYHRHW